MPIESSPEFMYSQDEPPEALGGVIGTGLYRQIALTGYGPENDYPTAVPADALRVDAPFVYRAHFFYEASMGGVGLSLGHQYRQGEFETEGSFLSMRMNDCAAPELDELVISQYTVSDDILTLYTVADGVTFEQVLRRVPE